MTRFDASFGEEKNVRRRPAFPFLSLLLFQRVLCFSLLSSCFCAIRSVLSKTLKKKDEFKSSFVPRKTLQKFLLSFPSRCGVCALSFFARRTTERQKERRRVCLSLFAYRGVDAIRRNEERERRAKKMVEVIELLDSDEEGDERIRIVQRQNEQDVRPVGEEGRRDGDVVITGTRAPHAEERERERDALSNFLGVGFFFPRARAIFF